MINAVTGKVGTGIKKSGNPPNQELALTGSFRYDAPVLGT